MLKNAPSTTELSENALLTLIKRVVHLKIERIYPWCDDVHLMIDVNNFNADATCKMSDLSGFISQESETIAEYEVREQET